MTNAGAEVDRTAHAHARPDDTARARRFRQAAIVYLHVGILYEAAVYVFWRHGLLPATRGPGWMWLLVGAAIALGISYAIWRWQKAWLVLTIWALHALRLPALIEGAFFTRPAAAVDTSAIPAAFYLTALIVVIINLGFLARAGFDL